MLIRVGCKINISHIRIIMARKFDGVNESLKRKNNMYTRLYKYELFVIFQLLEPLHVLIQLSKSNCIKLVAELTIFELLTEGRRPKYSVVMNRSGP